MSRQSLVTCFVESMNHHFITILQALHCHFKIEKYQFTFVGCLFKSDVILKERAKQEVGVEGGIKCLK